MSSKIAKQSNLLIAVVGVHVLQRCGHQLGRDIPIDEGQRFPCLQVTVGLWAIFIVAVTASVCLWSLGRFFCDAPFNGRQRLRDEGVEAVRSGRYKQLCHLVILLLYRTVKGSAGTGSCINKEKRHQVSEEERIILGKGM